MRLRKGQIAMLLACAGVAGGIAGRIARALDERRASGPAAVAPPAAPSARAVQSFEVAESVYDGTLGAGWQDWGWGRHNLSTVAPARVVFEGYGGIIFHHQELPSDFGALSFRLKAPAGWAPFLAVALRHAQKAESEFPTINLKAADLADAGNGWQEAWVEWARLNPSNLPFDRVVISASRQVGSDWIELDKVVFAKRTGKPADAPVRDAQLTISCDGDAKRINSNIYGITWGAWENGGTAQRIGGNVITRLNWDLGAAWNSGSDWFFENTSGAGSLWQWVEDAVAHHAMSAVTVPMIGWVAKDTTSVGFPVSKFGKQRAQDPNRPDAGDGYAPDGRELRPGSPAETSVPAPPDKIARWVEKLRTADVTRGKRGVLMYILDNEPSLWDHTHRDVHPEPVSQDELLKRTIDYASAVRKADPTIPIAGPAEWGWTGYFYSAKDRKVGEDLRPDRLAHGDVPLVAWYLAKLAEYQKTKGVKLLDVLDLHFYPQAERIFGPNPRTDREGSALRIRATRALWDPTYVDESWINQPVRLIPRMREWVAENYPGLQTSIGEWSFGADDHISGALASAEALGRFGQQGLDSAFYWGGPKPGSRSFWAFRAFRDFDGAGSHFLDWSIPTQAPETLSLFASRDDTGTHVVAVLLNLNPSYAVRARIDTQSCGKLSGRRAFTYTGDPRGIVPEPSAVVPNALAELVPPYSIRILDLAYVPSR
jgi:hypothetical protein